MKSVLLALVLLPVLAGAAEKVELYCDAAANVVLPQGGSGRHATSGALLRTGAYFTDNVALEGEVGWAEHSVRLATQTLMSFSAIELYDRFFGFSPFDPFVTLGVAGWTGRDLEQVGPKVGLGAFYHLSDAWALRADSEALLGVDTCMEMFYTITLGVHYSF